MSLANGQVINSKTGLSVISLAEVGRIGYFRQDTLPKDFDVQLSVNASFVANDKPYYMANGVQGSYVDVDAETGFVAIRRLCIAVNRYDRCYSARSAGASDGGTFTDSEGAECSISG